MRIVRIVSELGFGGVEQVIAYSLPDLSRVPGCELKVIVLGKGGQIEQQLRKKGIAILVLDANPRIPNLMLLWKLWRLLLESQAEVVHCQGAEANFHGILAAKWAGVSRILGEEIGIPNHHTYWGWIFRQVYRRAHEVIAISQAVKNYLVEAKEVEGRKVSVIYNPVAFPSEDFPHQSQSMDGVFTFICVCRLVPVKNLDSLIIAAARLKREEPLLRFRIQILGEGPERAALERLVHSIHVSEHVDFLGFQANVWPYLRSADAFILPSFTEGSSVALVEAMGAGLPAIVTREGGAEEVLGSSETGFLIDPRQLESISGVMKRVLTLDKKELKEMGNRAQLHVQQFNVAHYLDQLLACYQPAPLTAND